MDLPCDFFGNDAMVSGLIFLRFPTLIIQALSKLKSTHSSNRQEKEKKPENYENLFLGKHGWNGPVTRVFINKHTALVHYKQFDKSFFT